MTWFMVDVETDGPCPGLYSMISFGVIAVKPGLDQTFYAQCAPISDQYLPEALAISGHTRKECLAFPDPKIAIGKLASWLQQTSKGRPYFISDNNGFDWQFINYYFHKFYGRNPFGHSSTNLGSLYKGLVKDTFKNFKHLRKTKHTHHPVDDAKGNAEALLQMKEMGLIIKL